MSPIPVNRARIFRRRFSLEAPPGAYADIEALGTNYFFQLRYPIYEGEQVLFQDAACTVPVTLAGQHTIGGVKDPFTGDIIATQATSARRPLWVGTTAGAYFDGTDLLVVADGAGVQAGTTLSIADFVAMKFDATTGVQQTVCAKRDADSTTLYQYRVSTAGALQAFYKDAAGQQQNMFSATTIDAGDVHLFTMQYDRALDQGEIYLDTSQIASDTFPVLDDISVASRDITYGGFEAATLTDMSQGTIQFAGQFLQTDAIGSTEITTIYDVLTGMTVDVRQITDWADAGTGTVDGELLLLTNASNQDAIFQWDEAGSEWELVSTFDASFDADSTVDANLYPTDFRGTQNFRNPPPTVSDALAAWDFRYDDLGPGDAYSSVTDLIGSLDATQANTSYQPVKGTQSGYPGEYATFGINGGERLKAGTVSSFNSLHQGDGFILAAVRFDDVSVRSNIVGNGSGSDETGITLALLANNLFFYLSDGTGTYPDVFALSYGSAPYSSDTWGTVGISWEGTTAKWWINGVQSGSDVTITSTRATGDAAESMSIGETKDTISGDSLDGDLASVFISDGGHPSTAEVAALHDWMVGA